MLAGPFEAHGLVETLSGFIVLPYTKPNFAQSLVPGSFEGLIDQRVPSPWRLKSDRT